MSVLVGKRVPIMPSWMKEEELLLMALHSGQENKKGRCLVPRLGMF